MGDYFGHWLKMEGAIKHPPRIFMVNWFRKGSDGKFLWPGFGENLRVLKWMLDRIDGGAAATNTPVGRIPRVEDLNLRGLEGAGERMREDLAVKPEEWSAEVASTAEFFDKFGPTMPQALREKHRGLANSLNGTRP
jgi:phosphoenolpyruvate carboxykinase (GTP)